MQNDINFNDFELPEFKEVRLEVTNACSNKCFCCPREKMSRAIGFFDIRDIDLIIRELSYLKNEFLFHLVGFGEPLLLQNLPEISCMIKEKLNKANTYTLTTLSVNRTKEYFKKLLESFDLIEISFYAYTSEQYQIVHGSDSYNTVIKNLQTLSEIRSNFSLPTVLRIKLADFSNYTVVNKEELLSEKSKMAEWLKELGYEVRIDTALHNYGNGRNYMSNQKNIPCSIAWGNRRSILQLTWDLNVIPCCFMFDAEVIWGNLKEESLQKIFAGEKRQRFLRNILAGNIKCYKSCINCHGDTSGTEEELAKLKAILEKNVNNN